MVAPPPGDHRRVRGCGLLGLLTLTIACDAATPGWAVPPLVPATAEPPPWFGDLAAPPVAIAGRVHDAGGPLTVRLTMGDLDLGAYSATTTTAGDGSFAFPPQRRGHYQLVAFDARRSTRVVQVDAFDPVPPLDLSAVPCVPRRGYVVGWEQRRGEPHRYPLAGATVWMHGLPVTRTGTTGEYEVCGPPYATRVAVTAPGREAQSAEHPSTTSTIGGVSLGVAAQACGWLRDPSGRPLGDVGVIAWYPHRIIHGPSWDGQAPHAITTDADGWFCYPGVNDERPDLIVRAAGQPDRHARAERFIAHADRWPDQAGWPNVGTWTLMREDAAAEPSLTLLRGRVLHAGAPVPDAWVRLFIYYADGTSLADDDYTDPDGRFVLAAPAPLRSGAVNVFDAASGRRAVRDVDITPDAPEVEIWLDLPPPPPARP